MRQRTAESRFNTERTKAFLVGAGERIRGRFGDHTGLLVLVLSALLVRVLWAVLFAGEIDTEGAEYARIAQNLLAGKGYVGIATPGTQLCFPPLFPFLIAGVTWIIGDAEVAGRIVSIVFGALLVIPVYSTARRMFGERTALGAAALTAFHPYLVVFSTTVFCESTFLTLFLAAVASAMYAASNFTPAALAVSGGLYGASYLVRPESLLYMLIGLGYILLVRLLLMREKLRSIAGQALLMPIVFFVIASPYIFWLSAQVGHLRFESKSPLNVVTQLRVQSGLSEYEAAFAVDQNLTEQGVWNQPNINTIRSYRSSLSELVTMIAKKTKTVLQDAATAMAGNLKFGSPALFALAVLGLFGRAWRPRLALDQLHLLALLSLSVVATYFITSTTSRFYLVVLILFSIWVCAAMRGLGVWAWRSASLCGFGSRQQVISAVLVPWLAIAAVIVPAAAWAAMDSSSMRGTRAVKAAAKAMAASRAPLRIADASTPFAFHAGADFVWLPYADEATALRFLKKKQVTHVVVRSYTSYALESVPYLKKWLANGVPGARLTAQVVSGSGEKVFVYDLRPGDGAPPVGR